MRGLSLVAASGGHSSSRCAGLSLSRPLLLRGTGSRRAGSVIVAHGPSRSAARGIFPDQGSNPCPLHRQADSQPQRHQGSPSIENFKTLTAPKWAALYYHLGAILNNLSRDFPGAAVVKAPCCPCRGARVQSLVRELHPTCMPQLRVCMPQLRSL